MKFAHIFKLSILFILLVSQQAYAGKKGEGGKPPLHPKPAISKEVSPKRLIIQAFLKGERPQDVVIAELIELGTNPKEVQAIIEELSPPNKQEELKGEARRVYETRQRQIKAFLSAYAVKYRAAESAARGAGELRWEAPSSVPEEKRKHIKVTNEHFFGDPNLAENMTLEELALLTEMFASAAADLPGSLVFQEVLNFLRTLLENNILISTALATKQKIPHEISERLRSYALHHGQRGDIQDCVPYQHKPHMLLQTLYRTYRSARELGILADFYRQFTGGGCLEAAIRAPEIWVEAREEASKRAQREGRKGAELKRRGLRDIITSVLQTAALEEDFPEVPGKGSGEEALEAWVATVVAIVDAAIASHLIENGYEDIPREHIENLLRACALNLAGAESIPLSAMATPSPAKKVPYRRSGLRPVGLALPLSAGASVAAPIAAGASTSLTGGEAAPAAASAASAPSPRDLPVPSSGYATPIAQVAPPFPSAAHASKEVVDFHDFAIGHGLYSPAGIEGACFWEALSYALFGAGIELHPQELLALTTTYMHAHPEQFVGAVLGASPQEQLQNLNAFIEGQVLGTWANEIIVGAAVAALQEAGHQVHIVMESYNIHEQLVGAPVAYVGQNGSTAGLIPLHLVNFALVHFLAQSHSSHAGAVQFVEEAHEQVVTELSVSVMPILLALQKFILEHPIVRVSTPRPGLGSAAAAPFAVPRFDGGKKGGAKRFFSGK